jgi:hypothetical protein
MSNGTNIAYHLRPNKAIERNLFVELLRKIDKFVKIEDYSYISFGGPFLEDFKQIHNALQIEKMFSIEMVENTHKRQAYNMPVSCIDIGEKVQTGNEFIHQHEFDSPTIIWLDYSEALSVSEQLDELSFLITKLAENDIFKITINAHVAKLGSCEDSQKLREFRLKKLSEHIEERHLPDNLSEEDVSTKGYVKLMLKCIQKAAQAGLTRKDKFFIQPLTAFEYSDGMTMLTATAMILNKDDKERVATQLGDWAFYSKDWSNPKNINIPNMSIKERLAIEAMLPKANPDQIISGLGFYIGGNLGEAKKQMTNFIDYYKVMPWYSKVIP